MQEKLSAQPSADGAAVDLSISDSNGTTSTVAVPVEQVGRFATGLFSAAIECAQRSRKFSDLNVPQAGATFVRHAHAVGLSRADDDSDMLIMIFAIGGTDLAVAVPHNVLAPLGESLQEYGAAGDRH